MSQESEAQAAKTDRHQELLNRIESVTELPLLLLAFLMVPLLLGPLLWPLSPGQQDLFLVLDSSIWALFAIDLGIKVTIAPHKRQYLRHHWLDVLIVVIPFFRPLRLLRLIAYGTRAVVGVRRLVHVDFLLVYGLGLIVIAATVMPSLEASVPGASIHTFGDALWWAAATITTVGYGDKVPVTAAGHAVAVVLMLGGIAFYSGVTANLASLLTRGDALKHNQASDRKLDEVLHEVQALRQELSRLREGQR